MRASAWRMMRKQSMALIGGVALVVATAACERTPFYCDMTHHCDLTVGSVCTHDGLCAVRESECPSGYVYDRSTLHAGTCVPRTQLDLDGSPDGDATASDGNDIADAQDIVDVMIPPCPDPRPISPLSVSRITSNHVQLAVRVDPAAGPATVDFEMYATRTPSGTAVSRPMRDVASDVATAMVDPTPGTWFWRAQTHCTNTDLRSGWSPVWEFVAPHRETMSIVHSTALPGPLDFNGDGRADLAVGIPGLHAVAIYLGPIATIPAAPIIVTGADAFGSVVATAGDLNGDGFSDLLVGACPAQDEGSATRTCGNAVTVVFGNSAGSPSMTRTVIGPSSLPFDAGTGSFGTSISGAGDLNGDGYGDFVVGTAFYPSAGSAVVYFGGVSVPSVPGIVITNPDPAHLGFGTAVAGLGDIDGDGLSDIAVGGANLIAVYRGNHAPMMFRDQTATLVPTGGSSYLGIRLASAGDVDADGLGDLIAADPRPTNPEAFVFQGSTLPTSGAPYITIGQQSPNDATGSGIAGGDDLDGNGFDDFIVGSPDQMSGVGVARVFYGRVGGADPNQTLVSPLVGVGTQARFGLAVSMVGALDGHTGSVAVGAPGYFGPSSSAPTSNGNVFIYSDHGAAMPPAATTLNVLFLMPDAPVGAGFGRSLAQAASPASARLRWALGLSATTPF